MVQLSVAMKELIDEYKLQKGKLEQIKPKIDLESLQINLRELEAKSLKSDFWTEIKSATSIMQEISAVREQIKEITDLESQSQTLAELVRLSESETSGLDIPTELKNFSEKLSQLETKLFLSEPHDQDSAFLSVHAGQGGVEAMDWAAMLLRMYERYTEIKDFKASLVNETKGEEAGIKSATISIEGRFAYGLLKKESGTHRLVRLSPFNADNLRQTSFALVEVLPAVDAVAEIDLKDGDLEWDTFRSSGPGGQNVQKVSTAVRVKHLPTGLTVSMQSERSQFQNKENALKILRAKLFQLEEEKRLTAESSLKDWQKTASWGTQIRSYVLHPYQQVKDLRSNFETNDTQGVLDGKLDQLIDAELRI